MFPPNEEAMMTDVDDAFRVVSINARCSIKAFRSCCRARLRSVAIGLAFCSPPLGQDENASSMGQCKEGRGAAHQINPSYSSSRCCTPGSRAPSAYRVGRSAKGVVVGTSWLHSCRVRPVDSCYCRVDDAAVVTVEVCRLMESSSTNVWRRPKRVVVSLGDQIIIGRGEGLSIISPLSLLLISGNLMGHANLQGLVQGRAGPASTRLPGWRGWAAAK